MTGRLSRTTGWGSFLDQLGQAGLAALGGEAQRECELVAAESPDGGALACPGAEPIHGRCDDRAPAARPRVSLICLKWPPDYGPDRELPSG